MDIEKKVEQHEVKIAILKTTLDGVKEDTSAILDRLDNGIATVVHDHEQWIDRHNDQANRWRRRSDYIWIAVVVWMITHQSGLGAKIVEAITQ